MYVSTASHLRYQTSPVAAGFQQESARGGERDGIFAAAQAAVDDSSQQRGVGRQGFGKAPVPQQVGENAEDDLHRAACAFGPVVTVIKTVLHLLCAHESRSEILV